MSDLLRNPVAVGGASSRHGKEKDLFFCDNCHHKVESTTKFRDWERSICDNCADLGRFCSEVCWKDWILWHNEPTKNYNRHDEVGIWAGYDWVCKPCNYMIEIETVYALKRWAEVAEATPQKDDMEDSEEEI